MGLRSLGTMGILLAVVALLATACGPAAAPAGPAAAAPPAPSPAPRPSTPVPATAPTLRPAPTPQPPAPTQAQPATVTAQELKALLDAPSRPLVFDARTRDSFDAGHIPGAVSMPLPDLNRRIAEVPRDRLSVFYCSGAT